MTRAIVTAWHKYTPWGDEFYAPMFDFFITQMQKFKDEYDKIYFLDSTWNFTNDDYEKMKTVKGGIIKVDPSLRYYDAYKEVLPQIQEDLILFMDNDMVVYRPKQISGTFDLLEAMTAGGNYHLWDVVSIIDQIGEYKTSQLKNGNKFCPYLFATKKDLLMGYTDVEWGPNMPKHETLGKLTEEMLNDGVKVFEWEEDKSNILLNQTEHGTTIDYDTNNGQMSSKDLGYYHIRAGSTPAYLLATKKYGDTKTYNDYLKNQPKGEYLRQFAWYTYMQGDPTPILVDLGIKTEDWLNYFIKFKEYHGLN